MLQAPASKLLQAPAELCYEFHACASILHIALSLSMRFTLVCDSVECVVDLHDCQCSVQIHLDKECWLQDQVHCWAIQIELIWGQCMTASFACMLSWFFAAHVPHWAATTCVSWDQILRSRVGAADMFWLSLIMNIIDPVFYVLRARALVFHCRLG